MPERIDCVVYRSPKKADTYLFVPEEDDFSAVPEVLLKSFGRPEKVMQLELTEDKKLARNNVRTIMEDLDRQGFHLQMPPHTITI